VKQAKSMGAMLHVAQNIESRAGFVTGIEHSRGQINDAVPHLGPYSS
jgi:hypothetical protein